MHTTAKGSTLSISGGYLLVVKQVLRCAADGVHAGRVLKGHEPKAPVENAIQRQWSADQLWAFSWHLPGSLCDRINHDHTVLHRSKLFKVSLESLCQNKNIILITIFTLITLERVTFGGLPAKTADKDLSVDQVYTAMWSHCSWKNGGHCLTQAPR